MQYTLTEVLLLILADFADMYYIGASRKAGTQFIDRDPRVWIHKKKALQYIKTKRADKKLHATFYYLIRQGYLQKGISGNASVIHITQKGLQKINTLKSKPKNNKRKKLQQGVFLMVFFDIPEKLRPQRDELRSYLKALGFHMWQKSVWVCADDMQVELKRYLREGILKKYVEILLIRKIRWR